MHETIGPATASTPSFPIQWKALVFSAVLAFVAPLAGCDDGDDGGGPADAASDTAAPVCRQADCEGISLPQVPCDNGGRISATCARGTDNRCTWTQARCSPPVPDAMADGLGDGRSSDGSADGGADAVDAADAGGDGGDAADAVADMGVGN